MDKTKYRIFDEDDAWGLVHLLVLQVNLSFDKRKERTMRTRSGKPRAKEERGELLVGSSILECGGELGGCTLAVFLSVVLDPVFEVERCEDTCVEKVWDTHRFREHFECSITIFGVHHVTSDSLGLGIKS